MKLNKIYSCALSLLMAFFFLPSYPGVVILGEVPEAVKQFLAKAQAVVQERLEHANSQSQEQYFFERGTYSPHITLAYVSDKELSMSQLEQTEPKLIDNLTELAHNTQPIDMHEGIKESHLVIWPGKRESVYEGNKYKNYAILVLKMKTSAQLLHLVENLDKTLEKHPTTCKREFPFSPHVTIGWLYDKKDVDTAPIVEAVKPALEKLVAEFKTDQPFSLDSFKLSTHDKKQIIFSYKK